MDDIRRPHQPQRRDYSLPSNRPPRPQPHHPPHQPIHHAQPVHQPAPPAAHQPNQPTYHPAQPAATAQHRAAKPKFGKKLSIIAAIIIAGAAIFGAGWLLKGSSSTNTIPTSVTRQVNYDLYFPSPMPAGYIYMKDTATFQIGQVYYKFANGDKRVTVNEQPMPEKRPDLSLMKGYRIFEAPLGQAAIGSSFGQATAVVLTKTTVITLNSVGGVSPSDLQTAITNLKLIGHNPQKT